MIYLDFDCDQLDGRLKEICEGTSGLPENGPGNTRESFVQLFKTGQGIPSPEPTAITDEPCVHRGSLLRIGQCDLCGNKGQPFEVFACDIYGECSIRKKHSKMATCLGCEHWKAADLATGPESRST